MTRRQIATLALSLVGCATQPAQYPPPTAGMIETIRYETGPCFGMCPVYVLTVSSDGRGVFEGKQHTAVTGTREFRVTADQFADFRSRLERYRPVGERRIAEPNCGGVIATDLPSVDITWTRKGPQSHLYVYYGCDMERNEAMFKALQEAPQALPIQQLIGGG
jgi:hypothetical protein